MERKKAFAIVISLSVLLSIPLVLSSGLVDVSQFPFQVDSPGPTPSVFADPDKVIKDYLNDPGYQIDDKFWVYANISDVNDLYTWHVKLSWNKDVLNCSEIGVGSGYFLNDTTSTYHTSVDVANITGIFNDDGYAWAAESVLGDDPNVGVSGDGRLLAIEFLIVGYGCSDINISKTGDLSTELLDSTGNDITFDPMHGYFKNKLNGDANSDGAVNILDRGKINAHWYPGPPVGALGYSRCVDCNDDGAINVLDRGIVNANWGRVAS